MPPLWLKVPSLSGAYLKAYARARGHAAVQVHDINSQCFQSLGVSARKYLTLDRDFEQGLFTQITDTLPQLWKEIQSIAATSDIVGFSVHARNASFVFQTLEVLRAKYPRKKYVLGGPEIMKRYIQKQLFHAENVYWVIGEGEIPLSRIIEDEVSSDTFLYEEIVDLDSIPFIDFDGYSLERYSKQMLPLLSSRGCTQHCTFCSETLLYKKFRHHSPRYMFDQIAYLIQRYGIRSFSFQDSLLNYSEQWLHEFCSLLLQRGLPQVQYEAQMRVSALITAELAELLKKSGCINIFVGMESASNRVLRAMNKGYTVEQAVAFFRILHHARLHFELSFILGYPVETDEDFKQTLVFVKEHRKRIPKIAQVNPFTLYVPSALALDRSLQKEEIQTRSSSRVKQFTKMIQKYKIRHTLAFLNNLIYTD